MLEIILVVWKSRPRTEFKEKLYPEPVQLQLWRGHAVDFGLVCLFCKFIIAGGIGSYCIPLTAHLESPCWSESMGRSNCSQKDTITSKEWLLQGYQDGPVKLTATNFSPEATWRWSTVRGVKTTHQNNPHTGQKTYHPQTCVFAAHQVKMMSPMTMVIDTYSFLHTELFGSYYLIITCTCCM